MTTQLLFAFGIVGFGLLYIQAMRARYFVPVTVSAIAVVAFLAYTAAAFAANALVVTGIGATSTFAQMTTITNKLKAKGYRVTEAVWFAVPAGKWDIAVGHSAGADAILKVQAKKKVTLDPTWVNQGCSPGDKCVNFFAPEDAFPLIVCCGGYQVRGARNIQVRGPHVTMPERIWPQVMREVP